MEAIDITPGQRKTILTLLKRHLPGVEVWAFGSRVKWTSRPESDLDLVAFASVSQKSNVSTLREEFEESDIPFRVDLLVWDELPENFQKNIRKEHVVIIEKSECPNEWLYHPPFPSEWRRQSLYSLADWLNGMAFRDIEFTPSGRPVIKIAEIKEGIAGQTKFTDRDYDERYLVRSGDMLFSWSGQPETSLDVSWWQGPEGWLNQHIFKVTPNSEKCTPDFLFYLLKYIKKNFIGIARNKQTTGLGHVTKADMERIEVGVPPKSVQDSITAVLRPLDDLIYLNWRTNETLEQIARALFNHHFPYPPDDDLPEGWRVGTIGEVCKFAYGKALKAEDRVEGTIPVCGSNGQVGRHNEALVKGPGIVVGRKGNPGVVTWAQTDFFPIDTTFYVVPKQGVGLHYLFHLLRAAQLNSLGADSAVPGLNRNMAYMSKVVIPPANMLDSFELESAHLSALIFGNDEQSRTLAALRDLLIPKLMSGEIRMPAEVPA